MGVNVNLEEIEKELLYNLMQMYNGNITRVANEMGIARTTLYRKLNKYGIKKESLL
ncbi:MAG: hypothetical protein PWQ37_2658 [Candidatus Petromonas sp.]|jgi:transcriptional regulator of acetoin/glycerol metabolism|nr:hypothetical protein [Candidatus Petromonas sp.]